MFMIFGRCSVDVLHTFAINYNSQQTVHEILVLPGKLPMTLDMTHVALVKVKKKVLFWQIILVTQNLYIKALIVYY